LHLFSDQITAYLNNTPLIQHWILVGDGSSDGTHQQLLKWAQSLTSTKVSVLHSPQNKGKGVDFTSITKTHPSEPRQIREIVLVVIVPSVTV
jgi:hypothetical protein